MASRDTHTQIVLQFVIPPQVHSGSPQVGVVTNTQGFESVEFLINSGLIIGTITPIVEDADNFAFTQNVANVDQEFLLGTLENATFSASDDDLVKRIGYVGKKQFVRLTLVNTGTDPFSAIAMLGHARSQPTDGS